LYHFERYLTAARASNSRKTEREQTLLIIFFQHRLEPWEHGLIRMSTLYPFKADATDLLPVIMLVVMFYGPPTKESLPNPHMHDPADAPITTTSGAL
jgi:hypothetical protein